jgi:hypothetical protein
VGMRHPMDGSVDVLIHGYYAGRLGTSPPFGRRRHRAGPLNLPRPGRMRAPHRPAATCACRWAWPRRDCAWRPRTRCSLCWRPKVHIQDDACH